MSALKFRQILGDWNPDTDSFGLTPDDLPAFIRQTGPDSFRILWTFERANYGAAKEAYRLWAQDSAESHGGTS